MKKIDKVSLALLEVNTNRFYEEVAKRLKREREYQGLSIEEVAAKLDVVDATVRNFEKGKFRLPLAFHYALILGFDDWFSLEQMLPVDEVKYEKAKADKVPVRYRLRVNKSGFDTPCVVSTIERLRNGYVKGYNVTHTDLSKTYWSSAKRNTAELILEQINSSVHDTSHIEVEEYIVESP